MNRAELDAAAAAGLIAPEQVQPLHDFLLAGAGTAKPAPTGEEDLRFIRNFHDVFLAIGIFLLAIGLAIAIATTVAGAPNPQQGTMLTGAYALGAGVLMWLLGEFFARRRRLFLPSIAIVLSLTGFLIIAAGALYAGVLLGRGFDREVTLDGMPPELKVGILIAAAAGIVAPALFYLRFRLPFALGLCGAAAAMFVIVAALIADFKNTLELLPALYLVLGLALFAAGVLFDARDPARATRLSDNGFWLHFAAAPLILNGALGLVAKAFTGGAGVGIGGTNAALIGAGAAAAPLAIATLVVVVALGLVSLLINRRALIVSALITTGIAIGILMNAAGLGAGALAAATLTTLGGFVLILGAGWHGVRRALLGWVRPDGVWARVFPPEVAT